MMRVIAAWLSVGLLGLMAIILFLRVLDASLEISDLKSQVRLQRDGLGFLQSITNQSLQSCSIDVDDIKKIAHEYKYEVFWDDQSFQVGPFKGIKNGSCIERIELVAF